jgi:hypothetical protein
MEKAMKTKRERVSSFAGKGCFIQGLGLLAPFALGALFGSTGAMVGGVILVFLFFTGSSMAMSWRCGHCKNPLPSKNVLVCPTCKADFE